MKYTKTKINDSIIWTFNLTSQQKKLALEVNKKSKTATFKNGNIHYLLNDKRRNEFLKVLGIGWVLQFPHPEIIISDEILSQAISKEINCPEQLAQYYLDINNVSNYCSNEMFINSVLLNPKIYSIEQFKACFLLIKTTRSLSKTMNNIHELSAKYLSCYEFKHLTDITCELNQKFNHFASISKMVNKINYWDNLYRNKEKLLAHNKIVALKKEKCNDFNNFDTINYVGKLRLPIGCSLLKNYHKMNAHFDAHKTGRYLNWSDIVESKLFLIEMEFPETAIFEIRKHSHLSSFLIEEITANVKITTPIYRLIHDCIISKQNQIFFKKNFRLTNSDNEIIDTNYANVPPF